MAEKDGRRMLHLVAAIDHPSPLETLVALRPDGLVAAIMAALLLCPASMLVELASQPLRGRGPALGGQGPLTSRFRRPRRSCTSPDHLKGEPDQCRLTVCIDSDASRHMACLTHHPSRMVVKPLGGILAQGSGTAPKHTARGPRLGQRWLGLVRPWPWPWPWRWLWLVRPRLALGTAARCASLDVPTTLGTSQLDSHARSGTGGAGTGIAPRTDLTF